MRTSIETKTNTTLGVEKSGINQVEATRNLINDSLLNTIERKDILSKRGNKRLNIINQPYESAKPLTDETHFIIESELAKMFGIENEKVSKLREDFSEPITLSLVLAGAEQYWESANDSRYEIAA